MIQNLSKNKEIVILKQGKDGEVMILDRSKYIEKCLSILSITQFAEIDQNTTAYVEGKVQRTLRKIKTNCHQLFILKFTRLDHCPESSTGLLN